MGPKMLPTIWGTCMKLVTKYQISAINSCWEKCAYMFNVYKNQLSRQTGSRNLMVPKTLPTIWGTYMNLVTKYQISAINSCWEKCAYMFNVFKPQEGRTPNLIILIKRYFYYTTAPRRGRRGILFYLCPSVLPSVQDIFCRIFSVTVDGRNLIFGHKHHIGIQYCG
jgi:hypothetical protein